MKTLALVLALAGLSQALQPGLEYQYRYKARVATGIPEVNRQFAAAGIQGDVTIQIAEDYTAYVKFDNVEVAEMNEMLDCDLRKPLPMEYHPIPQQKDLLEMPFRVTVNGTQYPEYMESPEEPVWVSNIRKSVVNIFRIAPLWDHTGKVEQLNFGVEEETLVGRCMNWYTSMKYPEHMADKFSYHREEYMEEDVQRGHPESRFHPKKTVAAGSSSVPLEENLWWVTRSTDFDTCHDFAEIRVHGNRHSDEVISRSSIGKYVIRGEEHRRLEQAVVEGTITVFTNHEERDIDNTFDDDQRYGYMNTFRNHERYDHVDTYTNQTIELKAVREIGSPMSLDYSPHHHYHWIYDIEHPEADQYIPLDQLITGRAIDETVQANIVEYIKKNLDELTTKMEEHPKHDKKLAAIYGRFVEAVNNLDYQHLESLHNELYAEGADSLKLYVYHQALIYSGTMDVVRFATVKLRDPNFDDHFHVRDEFYEVMDHTIQHPHSINHIMELLMSEEESETHNFGLMSFSSLVHDMCLGRDRKHFYYDYNSDTYGHCDQDHIINDFIPFLDRGMKNQDLPIWRRLMYLQALSNLGTPHTINILKPYITGTEEEYNVFVRTNAIWALNAYNMHETAQDYVYKLLMPIIENKWEQFEIRNIAFITLSTWRPNQSWWKRMAVMTWYDPSPQFTSFVYSTIDSIAHSNTPRNETAARVLHLCKPSSPPSLLHSENMFLFEYLFSEEMGTHVNFAWFASAHGFFPEEVAMRLRREIFYGYQTVVKFDLQQRGFDMLWNMFNSLTHDQERDSGAKDMVQGVWNELKEKLGFETPTTPAELRLWAKFDRLIFLANQFPINEDFFKNYEDMEFFRQIWLTMQMPHYFRFVKSYTAIATDVGLPFCVQYNYHYALWLNTKERSEMSFSDMKMKGSMEFVIDFSAVAYGGARTYIPWSDHPGISAGLYAEREIVLPFLVHATLDLKNYEFQLTAEPIKDDKITLYSYDVFPYVMLDVNYPVEVHFVPEEYKRLFHDEHPMYHYTDQVLPSDTGLWVETTREGDEYYYFNFRHFMREFRTTLHTNRWHHVVEYDPSASSTKSISFTFNYMYTAEGQQDREMTDKMQRISEMQQKYRSSNGNVRTVNFIVELHGATEQHYESSLTWSRSYDSSHANTKFHFAFLKDSHITCVNANFQKPKLDTFATMNEMFAADYHTIVKADIYDGENCDESPILEFEGSFDVSQEVRDRVQKHIDNHCEYNTFYPVIDVITTPVYDHAHFKANWNDNFPDYMKNMTYFVYDMARGFVYSKIDFDYTHEHEANQIQIDASRNLETNHWTVRTEKPHEVSVIHDMSAPMWMDLIASPAPMETTFMYDFVAGRTPLSCSIEEHKVRTFDGYEYDYHHDECWTTMAIDVSQEERGALMVRHSDTWEVRIIWQQAGMDFHITPNSFMINGEAAQGTDDRFTVHHYDDDSHTIDFTSGTRVRVQNDKVELLMGLHHRGHISGLCGNFDGEPMNDLMGPKGCSYTDYQMFAQSWMTPMEGGCGDFDDKVADVHSYQGNCPHDFYQATGMTYHEGMVDCTEWEYHERTEGNYHCKSLSPIPKCKAGCYEKYPHTEYMEYDCRYMGHDEHRDAQSHFVEESSSHSYYVTYPAICITQ